MPNRTPTLRDRIEQVVERHSQAKVARKTGVPPSSLSRYLQGRRVPADFCARLVRAFGLNPSWLLLGEGVPDAAQVTEATARTAEGLLELTTAMERIARAKLGALVDAAHGPLLRKLESQLIRHADLRAQVEQRARPLLADLVARIEVALRAGRLDEAAEWMGAAGNLEPLIPGDDRLQLGLDRHRAYLAYRRGDRDESLEFQRRALRRQIFAPDDRDEALMHGSNLVITLGAANRPDEAWRVGRALLALLGDGPREGEFAALEHEVGLIEVSIGRLRRGTERMVSAMHHVPETRRDHLRTGLHEAWCWAGALPLDDLAASERGRLRDAKPYTRAISAAQMLRFALVTERVEPVADWISELSALDNESAALLAQQCAALLAPTRESLAAFEAHATHAAHGGNATAMFVVAVDACQLARAAGLARLARVRWRRAEAAVARLPRGVRPTLGSTVVHARNTLVYAPAGTPARARSEATVYRLREAGYVIDPARERDAAQP